MTEAQSFLSTWAEVLLASRLDCELLDIKGLAACRKAVSQAIPTTAASVFFCHGTPEELLGHTKSILDAGMPISRLIGL